MAHEEDEFSSDFNFAQSATATCTRCGRKLKNAYQVPDGGIYGPICIQKLGFAIVGQSVGSPAVRERKEDESNPDQLEFSL